MSFEGPYQYGTPGGTEDTTLATFPALVRVFRGRALIGFLVVNTAMLSKLREEVEQVTRILDQVTAAVGPVQINSNGLLVDTDLREVSFNAALAVVANSPGYVSIYIPAASLTNAMLSGLIASTRTIANFAMQTADFADQAVATAKVPDANITTAKLDRTYLTSFPAGLAALESHIIVDQLYVPGNNRQSIGIIALPNNGVAYDCVGFADFIPFDTRLKYAFGIGLSGFSTFPTQTTPLVAPMTLFDQSVFLNQQNVTVEYAVQINNTAGVNLEAQVVGAMIAYPRER